MNLGPVEQTTSHFYSQPWCEQSETPNIVVQDSGWYPALHQDAIVDDSQIEEWDEEPWLKQELASKREVAGATIRSFREST